ncbi:hypothetical protein TNCT_265561 [Trichonephila clavata]|uniref:Uncharacterized protein n=1 Tax=Trichonephila clavata TaxID=2740835 RepID=A0A8X6HU76_TRICU|nr:hypothetical protein TNCT_265561 [Trichonephila clavata]
MRVVPVITTNQGSKIIAENLATTMQGLETTVENIMTTMVDLQRITRDSTINVKQRLNREAEVPCQPKARLLDRRIFVAMSAILLTT